MFTSGSSGSKMNRTPPAKAATKAASTEEESDCGLTSDCGPGYGGINEYGLASDCGLTSGGANEHDEDVVLTDTCPEKRKRSKGTPERNVKRQKDTTLSSSKGDTLKPGKGILDMEDWNALLKEVKHVDKEIRAIRRMMTNSRNIRTDITTRMAAAVEATNSLACTAMDIDENLEPVPRVKKPAQENTGTQTDAWEGNPPTCKIKEVLDRGEGYASLADILEETWPEEYFRNVKYIGDESKAPPGSDTLVVVTEDGGPVERFRRLRKLFPDWNEPEGSLIHKNEIDYMMISTETTRRGGAKKARIQHVYAGICQGLAGEAVDWKELYSFLWEMKPLVTEHGVRDLLVSMAREVDMDRVTKIAQYVFGGMDITLHIAGGQRKKGSQKRKEEEVLIVKATDGRNYSQIVRGLKSKVEIERLGVKVTSLKQSRSGDLLLRVEGGRGAANALKKEICGKDQNAQVVIRENRAVLFVTDIVAGTETEEVQTALVAEMGDPDVRVVSLKDTKDGNLVATVEVSPQLATTWIRRARVKIGWISCRVRGKPELTRCFRCLEYGHMRRECKGTDRSDVCFRCGRAEGHQASQCKGEIFCGYCKVVGHRQDSRACPHFRELLAAQGVSSTRK